MAEPSLDFEDYEPLMDRSGVICDEIYTYLEEEIEFIEAEFNSLYTEPGLFSKHVLKYVEENVVDVGELSNSEIEAAIEIFLEGRTKGG